MTARAATMRPMTRRDEATSLPQVFAVDLVHAPRAIEKMAHLGGGRLHVQDVLREARPTDAVAGLEDLDVPLRVHAAPQFFEVEAAFILHALSEACRRQPAVPGAVLRRPSSTPVPDVPQPRERNP